jgi:hypothetical protein
VRLDPPGADIRSGGRSDRDRIGWRTESSEHDDQREDRGNASSDDDRPASRLSAWSGDGFEPRDRFGPARDLWLAAHPFRPLSEPAREIGIQLKVMGA